MSETVTWSSVERVGVLQARAIVYVGAERPPRVAELAVGPLPAPSNHSFLRAVAWELRPPNRMEYSL